MSLKFVFGPSGSGKSYQLYDYVIRESVKFPDRQYIVLVPEQFTMQTQKDLVMQHPNHGIMNIDVLSFVRLAYRIFEETGGQALPVLDDEGKNLILRKIAGDYEKDLKVLKGNMKKLGYISEVKSVLSEFDQYDIGEEELRQMKAAAGENSRLYYKLQDLEVLYIGFKKYLEDRFITKEELLDALCRVVKGSDILKESTIVLDGFTGFTPVQNRLLGELLEVCREVIVTVTMDDRENPYVYKHPYQLFALGKHTVTSLIQIAAERKVSVEDPLCLYERPLYRFCDNSAMEFLERNIFRYSKECYKEKQGAVRIHVARNPREEAMKAAGRVRNLVRTKGYRYRDIGVIVSNMEVYGDDLGQAFDLYEIPVFMDHKRSILLNSFVEYIRSLLNMVKDNFSYESVFRFLRTNLSGFTYGEVDELENYVIALYHGLQLQLMVYMDAAVKMTQKHYPDKEVIPAGVFYYRLNDPLVEKKVVGEEEEIWQKVLKELKVDGVMNLKDETLEHLDHCQAGESAVIPVKYNKNGSLSKNSKVASEQEFEVMMRHALRKVFKVHQKILSGEVAAFPYRRKQESGCDYCAYRHICGFDQKIPGYKYRDIFEMTQSEVIAAMEADAVKENMNRDDHEKEQEKGTGSWE